MRFKGSQRSLLLAAAALCVGLAAPGAAWAGDDGQEPLWKGIGDMLGVSSLDKVDEPIKYSERPKLVLPAAGTNLPPPAAATAMSADWPHDPDVAEMKRKKDAVLDRHMFSTAHDKGSLHGRLVPPSHATSRAATASASSP